MLCETRRGRSTWQRPPTPDISTDRTRRPWATRRQRVPGFVNDHEQCVRDAVVDPFLRINVPEEGYENAASRQRPMNENRDVANRRDPEVTASLAHGA